MDDSPEVIRQQMEETRASLSEKLESLEQQVVGTVQNARAAVNDTVTNVKDAVQDTVDSVKDTMDIRRQMQRHPWVMLGGSMALGYIGGRLFEQLESKSRNGSPASIYERAAGKTVDGHLGQPNGHGTTGTMGAPSAAVEPAEEDAVHSFLRRFEPEIDKLKGLA